MTSETQRSGATPSLPTPPPRALPAPGTFGPFVVTGEIGRGGFGTVYRVRHAQLGVEYALKVIRPDVLDEEILERFFREMAILASLNHPNIVRVHTSGRTASGEPYYVMELLRGSGLDKRVTQAGKLAVPEAARLLAKVARGVGYAHSRGIVHRDLKPENILITEPDDEPRLVDFGLAMGNERERLTRTGDMLGTPSFMAPEQIEGTDKIGPAADVWALGVVLFHLTTGALPYGKVVGSIAVLQAILTREPPLPSSVDPTLPPSVDEVFLRCCERNMADRYATAAELVPDLEALARGEEPSVEGRVAARKAARALRRVKRAILALVAFGLLAASLAIPLSAHLTGVRKSVAREAVANARTTLAASIEGFDAIHAEPGDDQLHAIGERISGDFAAYMGSIARAKELKAVETPDEELVARATLVEAFLERDAAAASKAWEKVPGVMALPRAADPGYALPGARLALAAGDARSALARLVPYRTRPSSELKALEAILDRIVAPAEMRRAEETAGTPECREHLEDALRAGFVPERTPAKLAPALPDILTAADMELLRLLEGLVERGRRDTTPLVLPTRSLELLVQAGEALGVSSYMSDVLFGECAEYQGSPGKEKTVEIYMPRVDHVQAGDRLLSKKMRFEALGEWQKALDLPSMPGLRDETYAPAWHWVVLAMVLADQPKIVDTLFTIFHEDERDGIPYRVADCWRRYRWPSGSAPDLSVLQSTVEEIERTPRLKATSLGSEARLLLGEARLAAPATSRLGLADLVAVMKDEHSRHAIRELAASHGKSVARTLDDAKLAAWFDAALAGDRTTPPPPVRH